METEKFITAIVDRYLLNSLMCKQISFITIIHERFTVISSWYKPLQTLSHEFTSSELASKETNSRLIILILCRCLRNALNIIGRQQIHALPHCWGKTWFSRSTPWSFQFHSHWLSLQDDMPHSVPHWHRFLSWTLQNCSKFCITKYLGFGNRYGLSNTKILEPTLMPIWFSSQQLNSPQATVTRLLEKEMFLSFKTAELPNSNSALCSKILDICTLNSFVLARLWICREFCTKLQSDIDYASSISHSYLISLWCVNHNTISNTCSKTT